MFWMVHSFQPMLCGSPVEKGKSLIYSSSLPNQTLAIMCFKKIEQKHFCTTLKNRSELGSSRLQISHGGKTA